MSSAAQTVPRPRAWSVSSRTGTRIRQWSLRGAAIVYLGAMIALPVAAVIQAGFANGLGNLRDAVTSPGASEAIVLTLWMSAATAVINAFFGTLIAFALVRFHFPGRGVLNAIVDLPLAVPTLVTGVMLLVLYGPSTPLGRALTGTPLQVVGAKFGILLALLVVTLPFVVRTVQPVLQELDIAEEEAAATLGARAWKTFRTVILPAIRPAVMTGALLTFARSLGEFGSVVVVSGNITGRTLTAPVLISQLAGQFKPEQAAAVATVLFLISFVVVLVTTRLMRTRKEEPE
jgi:sulfate/thiosulfate transport system permease protein